MTSCRLYGSIGAVEGAMLFTGAVRVNLSAGAHKLSAAPNAPSVNALSTGMIKELTRAIK